MPLTEPRRPADSQGHDHTAVLPPQGRCVARPSAEPVALGDQVAPGVASLSRAGVALDRVRTAQRRRARRDPDHWPISTSDLRLQRRGAALELEGRLLRLRGVGHGPVPSVHARTRWSNTRHISQIAYPDHLSRGLVLVKWWLLAIPHYVVVAHLPGRGILVRRPDRPGRSRVDSGIDRGTRPRGWRCSRHHGPIPRRHLRPRPRSQSLGAARRCVRPA